MKFRQAQIRRALGNHAPVADRPLRLCARLAPTATAAPVTTTHLQMSATHNPQWMINRYSGPVDWENGWRRANHRRAHRAMKDPRTQQVRIASSSGRTEKISAFNWRFREVIYVIENATSTRALPAQGGRRQRTKCSVHMQMPLSAKGRGKLKKSSACPEREANVSCAGREPSARCAIATGPRCCGVGCSRSCACACRLRAGTPAAEPAILCINACRILEALISVLHRRSLEVVSLCCSHHRSERRQCRHCHQKLTHGFLPLSFLVAQPS
jgi:hypothetical protein